jgi:hypothetical protein
MNAIPRYRSSDTEDARTRTLFAFTPADGRFAADPRRRAAIGN